MKLPANIAISWIVLVIVISSGVLQARGENPPYSIPEIKTVADFSRVVYIDPDARGGNGQKSSPFNSLKDIDPEPGTAYLIKRGTVLNEHIAKRWHHNLLGAYGDGELPVISQGLMIYGNSRDLTIRDLHISKPGTGAHDFVIGFQHQPASMDVTIAFCRITGTDHGKGYPLYVIEHGADNLVFFNNEVAYSRNNGWWLNASDVKIIRNWFHNISKDGEESRDATGDIIQSIYYLTNAYIAGNLMDKSNAMWKYTLMLNLQEHGQGIIVEYNTFYSPKQGAGGAGIRWTPGKDAKFRKNLIRSVDDKGNQLVVPFETWQPIASQPEPYGIRDNHIIANTGQSVVAYGRATLDASNLIFKSTEQYRAFLEKNPDIGQYGSDINTDEFLSNH